MVPLLTHEKEGAMFIAIAVVWIIAGFLVILVIGTIVKLFRPRRHRSSTNKVSGRDPVISDVCRSLGKYPEAQIKLANELEAIRRKYDQEKEERAKGILRSCGLLP